MSYDGRAAVLRNYANTSRISSEKIKLSDIHTNVVRQSHECLATVALMSMKISYIHWNIARHSHECLATVAKKKIKKLDRNSRICHINVHSMRLQRESCVYIVNLCRKIVANYSQTSLQLLHSSEIWALGLEEPNIRGTLHVHQCLRRQIKVEFSAG